MKFLKSNKKYIDDMDPEAQIFDALDKVNIRDNRRGDAKTSHEIHMKFLREGRITIEQYNRLVEIYNDHVDLLEEEKEALAFIIMNRRQALDLKKECSRLLPKEFMFFVRDKTIDVKRHHSVSSIDLSSKNAIALLKNHILAHQKDIT